MANITGRQRYREHRTLFGRKLVVLQVEEHVTQMVPCGPTFDFERYNRWRDARVEDVTLHNCEASQVKESGK